VTRVAIAAALVLLALSPAIAAEPSAAALAELRQRILRGMTATVQGRLYVERARPDAPDEPLVGVGVLLVPRSAELVERLDALKRASRDSIQGFREAAPGVRAVLEAYERQLWHAGYPDAAVRTSTDTTGAFRAEVPAGQWVLVAERSVYLPVRPSHSAPPPTATALDPLARYSTSAYQHFQPVARLVGFDAVSLWVRQVDVESGETVALELHDRGLWLSGIAEDLEISRRLRFSGGGRKR
jgi:hypothetical protein